jgi:hypothetical protein
MYYSATMNELQFILLIICAVQLDLWLVALTATLYNKIFLGYRPCQLVKRRKNQRFKDHLCPRLQGTDVSGESVCVRYRPVRVPRSWRCASHWELLASAPPWTWNMGRSISDTDWFSRYISTLKTRTEMVLETLVFSPLNQLTWLVAREYFIKREKMFPTQKKYIKKSSGTFLKHNLLLNKCNCH